jgi:dienelactone hydrolase
MDVRSETVEFGVVEQQFVLKTAEDTVPGILWSPEASAGPRPTVLIGHGGTVHKRAPYVLELARRFVSHLGFSAVALDAPDHGERVVDPEAAEWARRALRERLIAGPDAGPRTFDAEQAAAMAERTRKGVLEWKALLDDLEAERTVASPGAPRSPVSNGRYGYWGLSMGTAIGLPFVATEPRIAAAVLGLGGLGGRPGAEEFGQLARSLQVPVLLIEQWDDELVARDAALALFDAVGSKDKALHIHPGGHLETPLHELDAYDAFFARHLSS